MVHRHGLNQSEALAGGGAMVGVFDQAAAVDGANPQVPWQTPGRAAFIDEIPPLTLQVA